MHWAPVLPKIMPSIFRAVRRRKGRETTDQGDGFLGRASNASSALKEQMSLWPLPDRPIPRISTDRKGIFQYGQIQESLRVTSSHWQLRDFGKLCLHRAEWLVHSNLQRTGGREAASTWDGLNLDLDLDSTMFPTTSSPYIGFYSFYRLFRQEDLRVELNPPFPLS